MTRSIHWALRLGRLNEPDLRVEIVTQGLCRFEIKPKVGGDYQFDFAGDVVEARCADSSGRNTSDQAPLADEIDDDRRRIFGAQGHGNVVGDLGGHLGQGNVLQNLGHGQNAINLFAVQGFRETALRADLLRLLGLFETATAVSPATACKRCLNDNTFIERLKTGANFTIRTYDRLFDWLSANWPADLEWPSDIPRPAATVAHTPEQSEAAA